MGRLNVDILRYLSAEQMRVLTAVEMGMKNHEFVVDKLVKAISGLKCSDSSVLKMCRDLCEHRLLSHAEHGYRLTNAGYDCLALKALVNAGKLAGIGSQVGVGKESDVYLAQDGEGGNVCVKLHRLGRTSFRQLKNKRDYLGQRSHFNWLYISRLSAEREFAFLEALHSEGLPVPKPFGHNRHAVVMEFIAGAKPLNGVSVDDFIDRADVLYDQCRSEIERLASLGLIHGDFNEFNLLVQEDATLRIIDLPQCISRRHPQAGEQYDRDCRCVVEFFQRKFGLQLDASREPASLEQVARCDIRLDERLKASGYRGAEEAPVKGDDGDEDDEDDEEAESEDNDSDEESEDEPEASEEADVGQQGQSSSVLPDSQEHQPQQHRSQAGGKTKQAHDKSEDDPESLARRRLRAERRKELRRAGLRAGRRAAKRERGARDARDMREELDTWG